ncbi:hypothetical protein A2V56_01055 [Candidatus Woesebacteria bacterium RBG_19FT_COMBO_42_9]|uniref:Four helix bundle protein n=1 Tax=Candidatus Woesebacteria bacterium RBG_16_42_24 TaxID=1802485 RepID=A0A1F7XNE6_9BACT|nr:MAG: hypothetical protein A2V97_03430 [Candidatus Woesebacteria bacterium RBG_16_42_24]OGM17900.1 MAG: hypothetical protein A2V56_01055 [Candidatus Woesebacteria bacterium RBG_19FT_COMBO_42_9]OGM68419.1 MAG: hypothetical protein A2985_01275 [Candidatus Woesebacteria bacterium RIFCSPLOWO2_01_FULL_43_11]
MATKFDSEAFYERLVVFAQNCQKIIFELPKSEYNREYGKQLIRSSASPGSNYIEALEALGRKDFVHRLRVCRKETRESIYWLRLILEANPSYEEVVIKCKTLINEGGEIIKILTTSILTLERKNY